MQVSTDAAFVDPTAITSFNTGTSSWSCPTLHGRPPTYYWRVQADPRNGAQHRLVVGVRAYTVGALDDADTAGPDGRHQRPRVQDVVLDWKPVAGAASYDLQVSTDPNFNTIVDDRTSSSAPRYSPPTTLNNDQYYWRVRPVDAANNRLRLGPVAPVGTSSATDPDQPTLQYPANAATVGDPFYYQWSAVPHASRYVVQLSTDAAFTDTGATRSHTTQTTLHRCRRTQRCMPDAQRHLLLARVRHR